MEQKLNISTNVDVPTSAPITPTNWYCCSFGNSVPQLVNVSLIDTIVEQNTSR